MDEGLPVGVSPRLPGRFFYERHNMSGKTEVIKGRVEEAAGVISGNKKLQAKGKADQAIGRLKQKATKAVDKIGKNVRT
jgi:uncharacterized protein YjbJ (UPF0337 family)